jgi:hypothetical protein
LQSYFRRIPGCDQNAKALLITSTNTATKLVKLRQTCTIGTAAIIDGSPPTG